MGLFPNLFTAILIGSKQSVYLSYFKNMSGQLIINCYVRHKVGLINYGNLFDEGICFLTRLHSAIQRDFR